MDYGTTAKEILREIGGEFNVVSVTHCMTRLRFVLKDESIVDDSRVKAIKGVAGVMKKAGQYQVIIGNDVAKCYGELVKLGDFKGGREAASEKPKEKQNPVMAVLDVISGCMAPVIPAIIGAGMVKVLIILLGAVLPAESQTMQLLTVIGDCAFYFLPMLVAFSAAKKFNTNPYLVAAVIGVLLHPSFISLLEQATDGVRFIGIPVTSATYSSTIIPSILTAWAMSWIERGVDRITPSVTKNFLKPALILLISAPVAFIILGPLGSIIGNVLASAVLAIQSHVSILASIIMAAAMPFIVMTGMHWAFIPVTMAALATPAGESLMLPAMLISNIAQGTSCLAVAVKSKNSSLKQVASASSFSALLAGVTEPGLYGVTMPLKRPIMAVCIASGITGAVAGAVRLSAFAFATPSLVSLPQFVSPEGASNLMLSVTVTAISAVLSFVLTWVLGFENPAEVSVQDAGEAETAGAPEETLSAGEKKDASADGATEIPAGGSAVAYAPIAGEAVPLSQVNDPTFAEEILGKGLAIRPAEGKVFAPFDGTVETVFETKHAMGLRSDDGLELLIHVGLETVSLNGKYFTAHVTDGQRIHRGDLLLEFDRDAIAAAGCETITPVIVSNTDDYSEIQTVTGRLVGPEDPVLTADRTK